VKPRAPLRPADLKIQVPASADDQQNRAEEAGFLRATPD
jgi:hypothetical protein